MKVKKIKQFLKNKVNLILVLILFALILIPIVTTTSRFVISKIDEHYFDSKEFYFNSDTLNGETYYLYNWDGTNNYQITIDISNSKDLLNWTKYDIEYEILTKCTSNVGVVSCSSSGDNLLSANDELLTNGTNIINLNIGNNTFSKGDTVRIEVIAKSISPYEKELSAVFIVEVNNTEINYHIEDVANRYFLDLIISNNKENKNINVEYDGKLLSIDGTNYYVRNGSLHSSMIESESFFNKLTFTIEKDNVYSIRFYKKDITQDYSLNTEIIRIS